MCVHGVVDGQHRGKQRERGGEIRVSFHEVRRADCLQAVGVVRSGRRDDGVEIKVGRDLDGCRGRG